MQLNRVRPSSLGLARRCLRSAWLSAKYPVSHEATRFGSAVDRQVSLILACAASGEASSLPKAAELLPEAARLLDWLEQTYPSATWERIVQQRVELHDPETNELLTAGTPDLVCIHRTDPVFAVIDWKKAGQSYSGHLEGPGENLQQLAYVTATWLRLAAERPIERSKIVLALFDERGIDPWESPDITEDRLTAVVEAIRAVPPVDVDGKQPEASVGAHCDHCYQRMHCDAHLLPLAVVTQAGLPEPFAEFANAQLTAETTIRALAWLDGADRVLREAGKIRDLVEANVDAFVLQNGSVNVGDRSYGPQLIRGRRLGASVATLESEGLERLIRQGDDVWRCKWQKT